MALDPISALFDVGMSVIERVWPNPERQAEEKRKLLELKLRADEVELEAHVKAMVGQLDINKVEAAHSSIFVAGWRPFVGWVCGFALAYTSIIEPILRFVSRLYGYIGEFPVIDSSLVIQVLVGMLGLVAARSWERGKGIQRDSLK